MTLKIDKLQSLLVSDESNRHTFNHHRGRRQIEVMTKEIPMKVVKTGTLSRLKRTSFAPNARGILYCNEQRSLSMERL